MASTEEKAYEIMRELDVSYVLVIFGGLTGYSSDGKYSIQFYSCILWQILYVNMHVACMQVYELVEIDYS